MRSPLMLLSAVCVAVAFPGIIHGQQLPAPVMAGLDQLKKGDPAKAIEEWTKMWPDGQARDSSRLRLNRSFGDVAATGDVPNGWELVRDQPVGTMIHRLYFVVFCARDPRYVVLSTYQRPDSSWTVDHIQISTTLNNLPGLDEAAFVTAQPPKPLSARP